MSADLHEVFARQLKLQIESYGADPGALDPEALEWYITYNHTALIVELSEALAETDWKPWTHTHVGIRDREKYKKELVDALHFFVNMCLAGDITAEEMVEAYREKAEINARRQAEGYDGVLTKCANPACRRELDSPGAIVMDGWNGWCCSAEGCGWQLTHEQIAALQQAGVIPMPVQPSRTLTQRVLRWFST